MTPVCVICGTTGPAVAVAEVHGRATAVCGGTAGDIPADCMWRDWTARRWESPDGSTAHASWCYWHPSDPVRRAAADEAAMIEAAAAS